LYKAPRGMSDILPSEQPLWKYIEEKAASICHLYGYQLLSTPVVEDAGLFTHAVADGTDIVDKEMYTFRDRGGQELALRPEGTAPVCRAYLEHGLFNLPQPVKLYYIGASFRYERPQAGRYRQHHQFGFEAIGEADPLLDAETIEMAQRFLSSLGLHGFTIHLNSIGCKTCRPRYIAALKQYYSRFERHLCEDCRNRLQRNPLRLLDCKKSQCQEIAESAPKITTFLCDDCRTHFEQLQEYLNALHTPFALNYRLVRGLDYYTRTVFEIQPHEETSQGALGGGGRYDNLIEALGGKSIPAVGFAAGIERLIANLREQQVNISIPLHTFVFIAYLGAEAKGEALKLSSSLREQGIATTASTGDKSLKSQLKQANAQGSNYTIILGQEEMKTHTAQLRNMKSGEQSVIPLMQAAAILREMHDSQSN